MSKLTNSKLRRMIMQELANMVGEDALISKLGRERDSHIRGDIDSYPFEESSCDEHGHNMIEGECSECGYKESTMLQEGNCGCGTCDECDDGTDYSIDSMTNLLGMGAKSMHVDFPNKPDIHKHKHNNYMARPQLYKIAQYAQKLLHMIPDGYELQDWQRSHLSSIADDISEVYHSLEFDFSDEG